jgi:hypothetical protein
MEQLGQAGDGRGWEAIFCHVYKRNQEQKNIRAISYAPVVPN